MSGTGIDAAGAASLLAWWRGAGVDVAVRDHAPAWVELAETATITTPPPGPSDRGAPPPPSAQDIAPPPEPIPDDVAETPAWLERRSDQRGARHVAALGPTGAAIMLLGDRPDRGDMAESVPYGGETLALLTAMMRAIGHDIGDLRQSLLEPGHLPGERIADHERLGDIARAQIRLAGPKSLILLGDAPARALIGKPLANARGHLHDIEGIPTIATFHPRWLLQRPQDKKLAWSDLLILKGRE